MQPKKEKLYPKGSTLSGASPPNPRSIRCGGFVIFHPANESQRALFEPALAGEFASLDF